jgi:hypothetical protein
MMLSLRGGTSPRVPPFFVVSPVRFPLASSGRVSLCPAESAPDLLFDDADVVVVVARVSPVWFPAFAGASLLLQLADNKKTIPRGMNFRVIIAEILG